jgi:hypothetical protein
MKKLPYQLKAKIKSLVLANKKRNRIMREITELYPTLENPIEHYEDGWSWDMYFTDSYFEFTEEKVMEVIQIALDERERIKK